MKKSKTTLFGLVLITLLSSCTPPLIFIKDEQGNEDYKDRQQLTFTHLWQRGDVNYLAINNLIKQFNESDIAKELNVYVKGDGINFWDYWTKVDLSFSGGSSPDIFIHAINETPTRINQLLNLTKMYEDDVANNVETLDAKEMFYESQINDIIRYAPNQEDMYAWPFSSTVRVVYYNKDLFESAGVSTIPTTWDELEEINKKLTIYNVEGDVTSGYKQIGLDPFTNEGQYLHQWAWLTGHEFWSKDLSTGRDVAHFDDPKLIEDFTKIYNSYVRRDDQARENLQNFMSKYAANNQNPFVNGQMAMMIANEGLYTTLKEAKVPFEYGVFEIPKMNENCDYVNWSSSYSIELYDNNNRNVTSEVAKQRNKGAWEFLKFVYQEDFQSVIHKAGFMLSNRQYYDKFVYTDPILTELTKAIEHTKEAEYIKAAPKWTSDIQVYVNNMFIVEADKRRSVADALKDCQALMETKLEQYYSVNKN